MVERVWKEHMEAIMIEKNTWDRMVNVEVVEGHMEPLAMNEVENHEKWQSQWTNWGCLGAPSCFSTWEASYIANSKGNLRWKRHAS